MNILLAVIKPAGIATHPDGQGQKWHFDELCHGLCCKKMVANTQNIFIDLIKVQPVLLLIAKHPIAKALFDRMIERK